jgi:hypothetical protein
MPPVIGLGITPVLREMRAPLAQPSQAPLISIHQIATERPHPLRAILAQNVVVYFMKTEIIGQ